MKNGICPKCGSSDVHPALRAGTNSLRPVEGPLSAAVYTTHYVCRACGFVEEWVKPGELTLLQQKFG